MTVAHSAPIFVLVDGEPFWKAEVVPALVELHRAKLQELLAAPIEPDGDLESWETRELLLEAWEKQLAQLEPRVNEADARYRALLERVQSSSHR